ncbi:hypothetical protein LSH36_3293g00016 [Paralvinella palmiformis]|uniref:Fucosyltransferase n=1 Tax=Paralvinella palmiformis TaxID=53620 RepID=A0AAD9IPG6_9ANNE|nr:hypothetical protein LSH36_3293g00016 [Paralvinella palmiformis]
MNLSDMKNAKFMLAISGLCLVFMFLAGNSLTWNWLNDKFVDEEYYVKQPNNDELNKVGIDATVFLMTGNETTENTNGTYSINTTLKTILFYNYYFHWKDYMFGLGSEPFKRSCSRTDCRTTLDRTEIDGADVVVFYGRTLKTISEIPKRRDNDQLFLYFNTEPPVKGYGDAKRLGLEINITVSYRLDSFIYWPYASTVLKTTDDSPYKPLSESELANKTIPIAWMVSSCTKSSTVRSEYVKELRKYIRVDIYGKCGNYSCPKREEKECMELLDEKYKFYLAFENSICDDYITEKSFRTLNYNLIPVVMGGGNYTRDLPPHSFIDTRKFSSPKQLARYLDHLNRTPEEYMEYFQWKHTYKYGE